MAEGMSRGELVDLVVAQSAAIVELSALWAQALERIAGLEERLAQNSGNSGKSSSGDPAAERQRQADERAEKNNKPGGQKRWAGKQRGSTGHGLAMTDTPDTVVDHHPESCGGCGMSLSAQGDGYERRQLIDLPEIGPTVAEHRVHHHHCDRCGMTTTGEFPAHVRSGVSYGPRVRAYVAYLLARQHIPHRRVAETMADLFGLKISTGTIDSIYSEANRRLKPFITALVILLRSLPVLHADETTDRVGTQTAWMHVASTSTYTLIHASMTRGYEAIRDAGVLIGYRGVIVHDRLTLYWKLKCAKHGLCGAHLLRDLADVAQVATQTAWAGGLARLLVDINTACDQARALGHKAVAPNMRHSFAARYDTLVADGLAANPDPGRKRDRLERRSYNLASAFWTHRAEILRYMNNLNVSFTNNQAERDLRPTKLHRKISGCFRSQTSAQRYTTLRSYLSTTHKNNITTINALTLLYTGNPWMPPTPTN